MEIKEFNIPVPWGHVAAKAWGNESNIPILMLHGMGDNAGTFDRLIPHLSKAFYYICIDMPGFDKYVIIRHSWGARLAVFFAQLYSEQVLKLITIDAIYLWSLPLSRFKQSTTESIDKIIEILKRPKAPPTYTYEEAREKVVKSRAYGNELNTEGAESLLKRALIPVNDKFQFSGDVRFKAMISVLYDKQFPLDLIKQYPITCPVLFIKASDSIDRLRYYDPVVKAMRKKNNKVFVKTIEGNHDVHNNRPEAVATIINDFLNKIDSKL